MTTHDAILDDDVILAEEAPQQVRVAEGIGPQGEWVAWAGGNRKTVRIIAVDDDAFYAKAVPFDKAVALMKELRDGSPPGVVLAKGRKIPIDKIRDIRVQERNGQIAIAFPMGIQQTRWINGGFMATVQRDLLDEIMRRLPEATRWHKEYSRLRTALAPLGCCLFFGALLFGQWYFGPPDSDRGSPPTSDGDSIGPTGTLVLFSCLFVGTSIWLMSALRNPRVETGIKPKVNFWGKSKKQPAA